MSKHQERVEAAIRKGIAGVLDGTPDERRDGILVSNKAVDIETLLEIIDELRTAPSPAPSPSPAPAVEDDPQ